MRSKSYCIKIAPIAWHKAPKRTSRSYDSEARDKVCFGLYLSQQHNDEPFFDKPIRLDVTFYMPLPKPVKDKPKVSYISTQPSLECLYKFFIDAIKDIIITDNRVICSLSVKKVYDKDPRTEWIITEVE